MMTSRKVADPLSEFLAPVYERLHRKETTSVDSVSTHVKWWQPMWVFAVHSIVGTFIFILIAVPAALLDLFVANMALSQPIAVILKSLEYVLFGVDVLLFAIFMFRTAARTAREL